MLNYENILLWRHADALQCLSSDDTDIERPLSPKGSQQARKMAHWLNKNLPSETTILSSSALRAVQTTQALNREYLTLESLAPAAEIRSVIEAITMQNKNKTVTKNLLMIGHQPWIGLLAAQLLLIPKTLPNNAHEISIKKGAVWWFRRTTSEIDQPFKLLTVQTPSLL
jgi:phosphohistidine phosphatase